MADPKWIRLDAVVAAHARQLEKHGGATGIRDHGLLESALMRPRNLHAYSRGTADLAALAACYAGGIVRNHPFFDGNKRTALVACRAFLVINGYTITASQDDKAMQILKLAASEATEEEFAQWLREKMTPIAS